MASYKMRITNKMMYEAIIWFYHREIGKHGLHDRFLFDSDEEVEAIKEMLRKRADRYKQNYYDMDKVWKLHYIHLSEYVAPKLDKDGGYINPQNKFLYVGK